MYYSYRVEHEWCSLGVFTGEAMLQVRWGLYVRRVMSACQIVVGFSIDNILAEPYTST
jgi:hypothetical protein